MRFSTVFIGHEKLIHLLHVFLRRLYTPLIAAARPIAASRYSWPNKRKMKGKQTQSKAPMMNCACSDLLNGPGRVFP